MLLLLLLCISLSAVLGQDTPQPGILLPTLPDKFSTNFMTVSKNGTGTLIGYGNIYVDQKSNKSAIVVQKAMYKEHIVYNYNSNEVLFVLEKNGVKDKSQNCDITAKKNFNDYDPKKLIKELTNKKLKYVNKTISSAITGNLWQRTSSANGRVINVSYSEMPWTFPSHYPNMSRPLSITTVNKDQFSNYYFFYTTDSVPTDAMMPPRSVFCPTFHDSTRTLTSLPVAFRVDAELYNKNQNYGVKIFYDGNIKVLREDFINENQNRFSAITDRQFGVVYLINRDAGTCITTPLSTSDAKSTPNLILFESQNLTNFVYVGNRTCWQGSCEMWSGVQNGFVHDLYVKFSRQNVSGQMQDLYVPIQMNSNWNASNAQDSSTYGQYFFNFEPGFPPWNEFDISICYRNWHKLRFQVTLRGSFLGIRSIPDFERNFVLAVTQFIGITKMRVHQLRVDNMLNDFVIVTLTMLEDPRTARMNGTFNSQDLPTNIPLHRAFYQISNAVTSGRFKVATKSVAGDEIVFYGNSINRQLISEQKVEEKGASLAKFKPKHRKSITVGKEDSQIDGLLTVDSCARQCDNDRTTQCNMFMFCKNTQACVLSESLIDDRTDIQDNVNCDMYSRDFAYDYNLYRGIRMVTDSTTDWTTSDETMEACFAHCNKKTDGKGCHSMDYCTDGKRHSCIFHAKHYTQATQVVSDIQCLHYSQKFLFMYKPIADKSIKDAANRYTSIKYDIPVQDCARTCFLDPAGCNDFEMCKLYPGTSWKSVCYIMEPKTAAIADEKPEFIDNEDCTHFRLKGAKTDFKIEDVVTDSSATPQPVKSSDTGGYGSGSMAGLAIPMLLIAGLCGAGAVYFYIRRQQLRGNDNDFVMRFVQ